MISRQQPVTRRDQARTRLARLAVVDAARQLFTDHGYGSTTVEAISDLADVPPATVYRLFSSKHGILEALLDVSIGGDDEDVTMAERPQVRALLEVDDPRELLAGFASVTAVVNERVGPLHRVLVSAAGSDADAAALLDSLTRQRQQGQRLIARSLARSGSLRPGIGERDAADLVHALLSPELYRLLVIERRWSAPRYRRWLTAILVDQLLEPDDKRSQPADPPGLA